MEPVHQVKFVTYIPIGPSADSEGWLQQGVVKSGYRLKLTATNEGLHIVGTNIDRANESYEQFVPVHQIQSYVGPIVKAAAVKKP